MLIVKVIEAGLQIAMGCATVLGAATAGNFHTPSLSSSIQQA